MLQKKLSILVNECSEIWWAFIENNEIAINCKYSYSERRVAAEKCEKLIKRRYEIIEEINSLFL